MQLTPNYNLKKPEGTDPVDIQDFNDNADVVDAALKKKAESSGGDISEMTVKTLDNITTDFPVPVAGEKPKTFLGKVKKFFEDTKNWMTGVCLIGSIVNNCVTDNAKLPLSAAQGKALMDLYTVLNTNLTSKGIVDPQSAQANINTDWVSSGSVYYRITNGICFVDFDLMLKTITILNTLIVSGLPRARVMAHSKLQGWDDNTISVPCYVLENNMLANPGPAGRYAGSFSYTII